MPKRKDNHRALTKMSEAIDILAEYQEFRDSILPALREDIKAGLDKEKLHKKYESILVARQITIGATSRNEAAALAAIKDLRDRYEGKPVERKDIHHKLEGLKEKDIDAILVSELQDVSE